MIASYDTQEAMDFGCLPKLGQRLLIPAHFPQRLDLASEPIPFANFSNKKVETKRREMTTQRV